jgi:hypothetical protein
MKKYLFLILIIFQSCTESKIVDGYTNETAFFPGDTMSVFINAKCNCDKEELEILDLYGNIVDKIIVNIEPQSISNKSPWELGFGYLETFKYKIPSLKSGFYFIENQIPFIVKSTSVKPITLVYPSNTINAYNRQGGQSLYTIDTLKGHETNIVSFLRPQPFGDIYAEKDFYSWIENQYPGEINYISDKDLDNISSFENSHVLLIPGHNEYWSRKARLNFDLYIDNGGNSLVMSGNTMFWQIRYDSITNKLICFRDLKEDPLAETLYATTVWSNDKLKLPIIKSIGADFTLGGYGNGFDEGWDGYKIITPGSPLLENTELIYGDIIDLPTDEFDGSPLLGLDNRNIPILDTMKLGFKKIELIGFDFGVEIFGTDLESSGKRTTGTFIVFQKSDSSGVVINTGSTNWCSNTSLKGRTGEVVKKITLNSINLLLNDKLPFSK